MLGKVVELDPEPFSSVQSEWSDAYIHYILDVIMNKNSGENVGSLTDSSGIFAADCSIQYELPLQQAEEFGFIIPDNVRSQLQNGKTIRPLFIRCYGGTSGDTKAKLIESAKIIAGLGSTSLKAADEAIKQKVSEVQKQYSDDRHVVVPFLIGHSLGGMFANALATKNHWGSMCFNALGLGTGTRKFVGDANMKCANTEDAKQHISMSVQNDFLTTEKFVIEWLVRTPGRRVILPNDTLSNPIAIHSSYDVAFKNALEASGRTAKSSR